MIKQLVSVFILASFSISAAQADLITKTATISDISLSVRFSPTGPNQVLNLGSMDISLADYGASSNMNATFTVNPAYVTPGFNLWNDISLHWVQLIWHDDAPAKYKGANPTFPIIDPPSGGWDYMYLDGAARTQPNNAIPNYGWFIDGYPWYYNSVGEAANSTVGKSYHINDVPGDTPAPGYTGFTTYLVAQSLKPCNAAGCLAPMDFLLLAGFDWTANSTDIAITDTFKAPSPFDVTELTNSLANGGFTGWTATDNKAALVPEPSVIILVLTALALLGFQSRPTIKRGQWFAAHRK